MPDISDLIESGKIAIMSGPWGTQVVLKTAQRSLANVMRRPDVAINPWLGADTGALYSDEGQELLGEIGTEYAGVLSLEQLMIMTSPTFRLQKQILEAATDAAYWNQQAPSMGLALNTVAFRIVRKVIENSDRTRTNTLTTVNVGPPMDCYTGEDTYEDIAT